MSRIHGSISVRFSRVYAKVRAGGEKREGERRGRDTRRAYSARCTPCRRYASRATRQDKRFYYEKSGGETKSRTERVRPTTTFLPSGSDGKYPCCRAGGRGRKRSTGKGASRSRGLPVHPVKFAPNRTIHHTIQPANPYSLSLSLTPRH